MNDDIVARIQTVIDHYGLTVSAFADEIGVQRSSISHLLNGRNKPSLDFVMKLINTYPEVNLYWLLKGEGSFPLQTGDIHFESGDTMEISKKEDSIQEPLPSSKQKKNEQDPVKIVVFYPDGTFQSFNPKND